MKNYFLLSTILASTILFNFAPAFSEVSTAADDIGITEKLGAQIDLNLPVRDDKGQIVQLKEYFKSGTPVILTPVYFACSGLCNFQLNGLVQGLKKMDWLVGDKFHIVAFSFDPKETEHAALKKENYVKAYGRPETKDGWHFITSEQSTIDAVTSSVGFKYKWDEKAKEWMHASAAIVISPTGKITRYIHGISFNPQDIKLALMDSAEGKIGTVSDKITWFCYSYDPLKSQYQLAIEKIIPLGGGIFILILMVLLAPTWLRNRKHA